jgi:hypothetical protein
MQEESCALCIHAFLRDSACRKDEDFIEELFGEFPMVGCRPTADVALIEKRWHKHPGVCDHLFAAG